METTTKRWDIAKTKEADLFATLKDYTLVISGNGIMHDYANYSPAPWCDETVSYVVIEEGVEHIGSYAFSNCTGLRSVEIPNSVKTLGDSVFSNCFILEDVNLPNTIASIGKYVFHHCHSLKFVKLPDSLDKIPTGTFSYCRGLREFIIPPNVRSIGDSVLLGCSLESITIPESVRIIGDEIFGKNNIYIKRIINESTVPQKISGNTFKNREDIKLYVPRSSIDSYLVNPSWRINFVNNIFPIESIDHNYKSLEQIKQQVNQLEARRVSMEKENRDIKNQVEELNLKISLLSGLKDNPK